MDAADSLAAEAAKPEAFDHPAQRVWNDLAAARHPARSLL